MASIYFLSLAILAVAGFVIGRTRAGAIASSVPRTTGMLHSLPSYHGLLTATAAFVPMLLIFVIGAPLLQKWLEAGALSYFPPDTAGDPLQRGAALRDIYNVAAGHFAGTPS